MRYSGNVVALRPGHAAATEPDRAAGVAMQEKHIELVRQLRLLHQRSLLKPRSDFDRACMLIAADETVSAELYAAALFHGIELYARRSLRFFNRSAVEASQDEMWLLRLLVALNEEDYSSARALIALRVEPQGRRRLMFLAQGLARSAFAASAPDATPAGFPDRNSK
jgi:hypothetical protein